MAALLNESDDVIAEINVTPFIDVVLVLLVVLMVTSTAIVKAALKVDLPKAASAGTAVPTTLQIVLRHDGGLWLDGAPTDRATLAKRCTSEHGSGTELLAVIAADTRVAYGEVVAVLDIVKSNGVTSFALDLQRDTTAGNAP